MPSTISPFAEGLQRRSRKTHLFLNNSELECGWVKIVLSVKKNEMLTPVQHLTEVLQNTKHSLLQRLLRQGIGFLSLIFKLFRKRNASGFALIKTFGLIYMFCCVFNYLISSQLHEK